MFYKVRLDGNPAVEGPGQLVELQTPLELLLFDMLMELRRQNKGLYTAMGLLAKMAGEPLPATAKDLLGQRHGLPNRGRAANKKGSNRGAAAGHNPGGVTHVQGGGKNGGPHGVPGGTSQAAGGG